MVRALIIGLVAGVVLGLLALLGSNSVLAGLAALVAITLLNGGLMARRMARLWPGARELSGADRVAVATAARRGDGIVEPRLAQGIVDYARALSQAREYVRLYRWVIAVLGVIALGVAVIDTLTAPAREAVVSWLYFAFFPVEMIWWPRRQARILANAERAAKLAGQVLAQQQ